MPPRRSLRSSSAISTPQKRSTPATPASSIGRETKRAKATPSSTKARSNGTIKLQEVSSKPRAKEDKYDVSSFSSDTDAAEEESGYEDEDATASEITAEDDADEYSSEDSQPKRGRKRMSYGSGRKGGNSNNKTTPQLKKGSLTAGKGTELWRPGVKTGLGAGTEVIIAKPKARLPGKTPYTDNTIHPNTMLFLGELAENNERVWLKMHDPDFRASSNDFNSFIESLQARLMEIDDTIPELPTKDIIFRIYRDVRFSLDQTPYKTHFSAAWSRTGRKGPFAAYYIQIKPGGCYVGGGLWCPEAVALAKLRRDITRKPNKIRNVLLGAGLRRNFFNGIPENEKKAIKAFTEKNSENALKTKPKGFDADHKDIELLRLRNFTVGRKIPDEEVLGSKAIDNIASYFEAMMPFITYLNSIVMPDNPDESDSDEEDDNNEEEEEDEEEEDES